MQAALSEPSTLSRQDRAISATVRLERGRLGLPEQFILYLGTIEPRKYIITLIDAYARLRTRLTEHGPRRCATTQKEHDSYCRCD